MNRKFENFGGQYVPETLMKPLKELESAFDKAMKDKLFVKEYEALLTHYTGRPSPLYHAKNLSKELGLKIYLKREDLNHTGSHKINNVIGQGLLAKYMGKKKVIAETGAGQHGVASATISALLGLKCTVYMGAEDLKRQAPNVEKMRLLGAEVISVTTGESTLKDATNEALRVWAKEAKDTFYIVGSVVGPHPYPLMVRSFQQIIGEEAADQIMAAEGRYPDYAVACIGGGSNSIGLFHPLKDKGVELIGVEAGGRGINFGEHAATLTYGRPGYFHGMYSYFLQDDLGHISPVHSISAGLDYPGVGPEHASYKENAIASYVFATDEEAICGVKVLTSLEGIIPALESAHAIGYVFKHKDEFAKDSLMIINLSGRGDKDMKTIISRIGGSYE